VAQLWFEVSGIDSIAFAKASSVVVWTSYSDEATEEDGSSVVVIGVVEVTKACCGGGVGKPVSSLKVNNNPYPAEVSLAKYDSLCV